MCVLVKILPPSINSWFHFEVRSKNNGKNKVGNRVVIVLENLTFHMHDLKLGHKYYCQSAVTDRLLCSNVKQSKQQKN